MRREKTANKFPFSPGFHYLCHMIRKANCKINIGLDVLCRREDGYHELATVMIPVCMDCTMSSKWNMQRKLPSGRAALQSIVRMPIISV